MPARRRAGSRKRPAAGGFPFLAVAGLVLLVAGLALVVQHLRRPRPVSPAPPPPRPAAPAPSARRHSAPGPAPAPPAPSVSPAACIVLDDVGYRLDLAREACLRLPKQVTFAVIPFLPASRDSAALLHRAGFPVILHAPMEPEDSGKWKHTAGELYEGMPEDEVAAILGRDLDAVPHAEGINNHMGSRATKDAALMAAVSRALRARGLYFLDSRTTPDTVAFQVARASGVPCAQRAVFLDDVDAPGAIMAQVDVLADRARRDGTAVAIGHLRPNTLDVLAGRIPYWESRGVRFVRLREVVR